MASNKKPANIEVLTVEVKGDNFSKAKVRCLDSGEESWHPFYRKVYKTGDPTPEERLVVPGARLRVAYQFKPGKAKGDGTNYPDEWVITDTEVLADKSDVAEVFDKPRAFVQDPARASIEAQKASDVAAQLYIAEMTIKGGEWDPKDYDAWVQSVYSSIQNAKNGKVSASPGSPSPEYDPFLDE